MVDFSPTAKTAANNIITSASLSPQTVCERSLLAIPYKGEYLDTHPYLTASHSVFGSLNMTGFPPLIVDKDGVLVTSPGRDHQPILVLLITMLSCTACMRDTTKTMRKLDLTLATFSPLILQ